MTTASEMNTPLNYHDFLARKLRRAQPCGFDVPEESVNQLLFPWQSDLVRWLCRIGRGGLFADTGLGKSAMQLEFAAQCVRHTGKKALILTPLAVAKQTAREAEKFKITVPVAVCREQSEVSPSAGITITNYERLHRFDPSAFSIVVLDEGSILKDYAGKTRSLLINQFKHTPFRLICTATPAPNDHEELGNHAEFCGVLSRLEMLATWFKHDSGSTQDWRLRGWAAADFWAWLSSWAVCVTSPADLDYPAGDFILPPLNRHVHELSADNCPPPPGFMFHIGRASATKMHDVKRTTAETRAGKVAELVEAEPAEPWLIWCNTNYEADELRAAVKDAVEIRGSQSPEAKEEALEAFSAGQIKRLITKPAIAGHGLNWQHCARMAFAGVSDSFEETYQAIRRCWRYGQKRPVDCHFVTTDAEAAIIGNIDRKENLFYTMREELINSVRTNQLRELYRRPVRQEVGKVKRMAGNGWALYNGDCVEAVKHIETESVGFSIFSPPFATLFTYSDSHQDMGNCHDYEEFWDHFGYLVPELYRVMMPGRSMAIHCMDLPTTKQHNGFIGAVDFPGDIIRQFSAAGFIYHARFTIWKDPLLAAVRTHTIGLAHQQLVKDSAICRTGWPDYVIVLRKPGDNPKPIPHPAGLTNYIGEPDPGADHTGEKRSHFRWRGYASPVWMDIRQSRTLNGERAKREARDSQDEAHICPLQLDVIERCLELWSTEGDLVLSPFAGIGSEGYCAIKAGRKFVGCELKPSYAKVAAKHLRMAEEEYKASKRELFA